MHMAEQLKGIAWEALEHHHVEKKSDWYWIAAIVIVSFSTAAFFLGNALLGIAILTGGMVMLILSSRPPKRIALAVTLRGLRIDNKLYPYSTLKSYYIDEDALHGPDLLVRSEKLFMPLLILPLPDDYVDEIEDIIAQRLPEEHLQESFVHKLLELIGL
jgi:hypothetical protein